MTITETHIVLFAGLTGDFNPMHTDAASARESKFGRIIAHGMLCASISSGLRSVIDEWAIVAMAETRRRFRAPVFAGDTVSFRAEVVDVTDKGGERGFGIVRLGVALVNQDQTVVLDGEDTLLVERRKEDVHE
jgi:acyl dehydratase